MRRIRLSAAQVQARFGATTAQQAAVRGWLSGSGLVVTVPLTPHQSLRHNRGRPRHRGRPRDGPGRQG